MGPALDDHSGVDDEDDVGRHDRREPVRDGDGRAAPGGDVEGALHEPLGDRVERTRRLVENEHGGVLEQHSRDRDPLLLAPGQSVAPLADDRVVAVGERCDGRVDVRGPCRRLDLRVRGIRPCIPEVVADARVEEIGLLAHDPDVRDEGVLLEVPHVGAGEDHPAARRRVEPWDEVRDGGLPCPRGSHERRVLAGLDAERDALERRRRLGARVGIGEHHVVELDEAEASPVDRAGTRCVDDRGPQVEILEDAGEQGG